MKTLKMFFVVAMISFLVLPPATAADFDWMKEMSAQAIADPAGFRARLGARFKIGNAEIDAVISNMPEPAHAYMALRLGEMSRQPVEKVMTEYNRNKGKGWGVMAKNLGIKPGSKEFHALKKNHDLDNGGKSKDIEKEQEKVKSKGKDKNR